jgi:hypothetical protein
VFLPKDGLILRRRKKNASGERIEEQLPKTPSEIFRQKKERGNITYHTPREIHTRVKIT